MSSLPPKVKPNKDETFYREWGAKRDFCAACGVLWLHMDYRGISTHHLIKPLRSHDATNLLRLCARCHDLAENRRIRGDFEYLPPLTLAVCLTIKQLVDPTEYDPARLTALYGRTLPDPEPIPQFFQEEWKRHRSWEDRPDMAPEWKPAKPPQIVQEPPPLAIRVGDLWYGLTPLRPDPGVSPRAWRVVKPDGKSYDVRATERGAECQCWGYLRHGRCKHLAAICGAGLLEVMGK